MFPYEFYDLFFYSYFNAIYNCCCGCVYVWYVCECWHMNSSVHIWRNNSGESIFSFHYGFWALNPIIGSWLSHVSNPHDFSIYMKTWHWNFIEVTLNLVIALSHIAIYTILFLPIHTHGEIYLLVSSPISFFQWFKFFIVDIFYISLPKVFLSLLWMGLFPLSTFSTHLLLL